MKRVHVIDSFINEDTNTIKIKKSKHYRYFLLIFEQNRVLDDNFYILGFGIGTTANRKYITKRSIISMFYFLTKLLIMENEKVRMKIKQNIFYTVDIGNLDNPSIINKIKEKHKIKDINKEFIIEVEDEIIDDFLYYYYEKKK